ncbi:LysM and putative peptidoglycan-binding domain-containing protein 3 [Eumeta japonica]|uniref:LysM and putative peptidoglycan-binding domain-containing protein 3 n=1 Tax=Eumeta variegata TaxID=151549 RepID=A0A4C1U8R2_EUMVA|nr:LysM and putative peptidoglycan-binding domain-containing protein 3 [Eumeta japonica]
MKQRTRLMHNADDLTGYSMTKTDDTEDEIPLHKVRPQKNYIEAQVLEGDTLQAIALRFYCSISELKRINQIHKDNEIFARRTIKVPVTAYSVLTELMPTEQNSDPLPPAVNQTPLDSNDQIIVENINEDSFSIDCNATILNSTVAPSIVPYVDEPSDAVTEDTKLLPSNQRIAVENVVVKELTSHGADLGLKWYHLVVCMLLLGVIGPVIYIMFFLDEPEHGTHPT